MTNGFVPKVPEENRVIDWVKLNAETVSTRDIVNDVYRVDTYIALVADAVLPTSFKVTEAQEKLYRDWLISQGWTPPKDNDEEVQVLPKENHEQRQPWLGREG